MELKRSMILAVVLVVLMFGVAACGSDSDTADADGPGTGSGDAAPLELSLGQGDALASCLPFEVETLAGMSPAFAGTATAVEGDIVTLDIDRWYTGGDAATATLSAPVGLEGLIAGFAFEVGEQYLITAADGSVNYCGYSGLATPEMTAAFDSAFSG